MEEPRKARTRRTPVAETSVPLIFDAYLAKDAGVPHVQVHEDVTRMLTGEYATRSMEMYEESESRRRPVCVGDVT